MNRACGRLLRLQERSQEKRLVVYLTMMTSHAGRAARRQIAHVGKSTFDQYRQFRIPL